MKTIETRTGFDDDIGSYSPLSHSFSLYHSIIRARGKVMTPMTIAPITLYPYNSISI